MCQALTTAEIAADADHAAYLRDMTEAYPWEEQPMTEAEEAALAASVEPVQTSAPAATKPAKSVKPTPILMTLSFADCVRAGSVEEAILAHPQVSVELAFLWKSEGHDTTHNDETSRVIRDWGRMRLRQWPVLDIDTGKTAETADFEWDSLWDRGEFSHWSARSTIAFHLPTLAECLTDVSLADEIFQRAIHCPWDGIDEAAWDALQAAFEAELAKPIDY